MRFPFDAFAPLRGLSPTRALALTAIAVATLLAAADWLPANPYVDPDNVEFLLELLLCATVIGMALSDRMDVIQLTRWRNRLLLLSFTLAFTAVAAEFGTRIAFRDVTTSSDFGGYFSRRWTRTGAVHLNSAGFRGREYAIPKPAGAYRIAAVGDSFTYGNGIRQEDRYSDLLQSELPAHFEVLNFGVPGANTPEHRERVSWLLKGLQPDFILVQWYVNDMEDDDAAGRPTFRPLIPLRALHEWLSVNSALYTVANMQWADTQVALGMTVSYPDYLKRRLADPNSHDSQVDRKNLTAMIDSAQRAGVPIGMVLFPDTAGDMNEKYPFGYLHDRVLGICAERGITCLDLRKDFAQIHDRRTLWASRLDHHPSARANAIAAERILETFSPLWAK